MGRSAAPRVMGVPVGSTGPGSADVDPGPCGGDRVVLGGAVAVQVLGRAEGRGAGLGVVGGRGEVHRQRAVPDRRGLGAADAGDGGAVLRRAVVADAVDGLGAAALGEQVEEVVGHARRVVDVEVLHRGRPVVGGGAVLGRLVHVPQRAAVAVDVDLLADEVVGGVGGEVGVELDHGAEDVGGGLVEAAGLAGVGQARRGAGDAVGYLVARDVERGQRVG